ncbi:DUF397 domain-containing protein [Streptomyces albus]|uniref:DUF397 domain-containing protein n=1 Tax=Streptomyces TaxID=1883 RepID=UPI000998A0AF|nr:MULTISPECIES: DUF397 domain-containing protein [Streptomyces]QID36871.1 DUF397 domain-containing protein [Streptomyces albus]GHJ22638.1 hypothetical protein TPA0909_42520 [Streptomyces albus]
MRNEHEAARTCELSWFKSSYSGPEGGNCVEVAHTPATVHVRDSKAQCGAILSVPSGQWTAFVRHVAGEQ